jgi:hypothetical protein
MLQIRKSLDRGAADHGWLKSFHSFSFAEYYDPRFMGFRSLRVINEDYIDAGSGFPTHGHKDMEIITYVIKGSLSHKDTLGNSTSIMPGEVQRMSAGTGIMHSEHNHESSGQTHLLQIWIKPDLAGHIPSYGQKDFSDEYKKNQLVLVISSDGRDGSISIHQDACMYVGKFTTEKKLDFSIQTNRHVWIQLIHGTLIVNNIALSSGDAILASDELKLEILAHQNSEFLLFDLA